MAKKSPLEKSVEEFILSRTGRFSFEELSESLKAQGRKKSPEKEILDILETGGLVFSRDFNTFAPRHIFFRKARFMISPTDDEVKAKILIPGHRFIPFCSLLTNPRDCVLRLPDGTELPRRTVGKKVRDILIYYSLYGRESLPAMLAADRPENAEALRGADFPDAAVQVTVFDFAPAFDRWKFVFGDGVLLVVEDWIRGVFTIDHVKKKKRLELMKDSEDWIRGLEKGFSKTFDDLGLNFPLEEQVAYAYFYAGKRVLKNPPLHLGGFIDSSPRVNFVDYGAETRLWHDTHIDPSMLKIPDPIEPSGATGSMDAIFHDLGISLSTVEVEAYMRDELFHRREDAEGVLQRIFAGRAAEFYSEEQLGDFVTYFEKLWNRVRRSYNFFSDQHTGKVRSRILAILDRHLEWQRGLDSRQVPREILPVQETTSAAQSTAFLVTYLKLLNKKSPAPESETDEILNLLPRIDESLENLRERIDEQIEKSVPEAKRAENRAIRLVRPEPAPVDPAGRRGRGPKRLYVLKIGLLHISPPIWRRVQVPGNFTLEDLHDTIQNAMGWDSYHAHSFLIDGKSYGTAAEEAAEFGIDESDESMFCLEELDLTEKKRFRYIYDFGDEWIHQVTVERVLPARGKSEEDKTSAVCLAGKRACPPEDCGGVPGYEEIIAALKAPLKKKYRERLDWLGDFDPEFFDLEAVNRRLRGEPS
jgi:hypothetical protein